jgi:hypothetical protein
MLLGAIAAVLRIWVIGVTITICYLVIQNEKELREFRIYRSRAPVEFSVELQWIFSGVFGGALVDVHARGLSEDPLKIGAAVS